MGEAFDKAGRALAVLPRVNRLAGALRAAGGKVVLPITA